MALLSARVTLLLLACLQLLVASGLTLGWGGVVLMFNQAGVFSSMCPPGGGGSGSSSGSGAAGPHAATCDASDLKLNFIFAAASASYGVAPLLGGPFIDRFGPRIGTTVATALVAVGFFLVAVSDYPSLDLYLPGFCLLAACGTAVHFATFSLGNLFPEHFGAVTSVISAMFGVSSLMFPVCHQLWQALDGAISVSAVFYGYAAMVVVWVGFASTMPVRACESGDEVFFTWQKGFQLRSTASAVVAPRPTEGASQELGVMPTPEEVAEATPKEPAATHSRTNEREVPGDLRYGTLAQQAFSAAYIFNVIYLLLDFFHFGYYLGSVNLQLEKMLPDEPTETIEDLTAAFSWIAPIGALFAPPIGMLIDRFGYAKTYIVVGILSAAHSAFALAPVLGLQYLTFFTYTVGQEAMYACTLAYIGYRFGFKHYGTLSGVAMFATGLTNLAIFPVTEAVVDGVLTFSTVNICFLVMCGLLTVGYPLLLTSGAHRGQHVVPSSQLGGDSSSNASGALELTPPTASSNREHAAASPKPSEYISPLATPAPSD